MLKIETDIKRKEENKMKKWLSVLLAAVMLLAMAGIAGAEVKTPTGTIKLTGIEKGVTVTVHQIIKWKLGDDGNPVEPGNEWANKAVSNWANGKTIEELNAKSPDEKNKLFNELSKVSGLPSTRTGVSEGEEMTIPDLDIGTYLIMISGENATKTYSAVVANVRYEYSKTEKKWKVVQDEEEVSAKAVTIPDIDKKINKGHNRHDEDVFDTVKIGDAVDFDIVANVPNYPTDAYETKFEIYDVMAKGLTYNDDLSVRIETRDGISDGEYNAENYDKLATEGTIFDLDFKYDKLKEAGAIKVHLHYTATINDEIELGTDKNTNQVTLKYQNNPYIKNNYKEKQDEVKVYTYGIRIVKYTMEGGKQELLGGAQFLLYSGLNQEGTDVNTATEIKVEEVSKNSGEYRVNKDQKAETKSVLMETTGEGKIQISGLKEGTYYLKEIKAPDGGYTKLASPLTVEIKKDDKENKRVQNAVSNANEAVGAEIASVLKNVENRKGSLLPSTGGMGTTIFMVAGIGVMACAVAALMLVLKRQKKNEG